MEVLSSNPAGLQGQVSWGFPVLFLDPQAGKPDVGLRIFTAVGELRWYHCSPVCESPTPMGMEFYFIILDSIPTYLEPTRNYSIAQRALLNIL